MDGPRRVQTENHLTRAADTGARRRGACGARPLGSQEVGRQAPSRTSRRQTTQADMDRSAAVTCHHVEHPHTRRHSHRLGQQGSHGHSATVSLHARRRTNHTTPRPSVQLNVNPNWKLRAGPWLAGSIICDQWTPDPSSCAHPPCRGRVPLGTRPRSTRRRSSTSTTQTTQRCRIWDDSTTHSHWRLLQAKHHLETQPHHGSWVQGHGTNAHRTSGPVQSKC